MSTAPAGESRAVWDDPRQDIGRTLTGDVLEVGPGARPFPTDASARVTYADRSVAGGRDANWPELAGAPGGPDAQYDVDLDVVGLDGIADESLDAVVASHVIEHVANPLQVLGEFQRVLRSQGRMVVIVPDRTLTFDRVRRPTAYGHVLAEYRRGVREVSAEHIREFCDAIFLQPSIHPPLVRDWHDPRKLDTQRIALHRRRSIHAHCWAPEEFAAMLAGALADGVLALRLERAYFVDDTPGRKGLEFGLVLERTTQAAGSAVLAEAFVRSWTEAAMACAGDGSARVARVARFARALRRDLPRRPELAAAHSHPLDMLHRVGAPTRLPLLDSSTVLRLRLRLRRAFRRH